MELTSIVRVSTAGQDTEGQRPANERWALANGHVITRTVEVKASAYKPSKLASVIDAIIESGARGVVMRRADRLSRGGIFARNGAVDVIRKLWDAGLKVYFADLGDAAEANELVLAALFHVAHEESRVKAARTFDNHRIIASRGAWTGVPPFGYSVAGSGELNAKLTVCDAEVKILRELFERCRDGASLNDLAAWACSLGYVRPTPKGEKTERPWCPKNAQLRKMLSHKPYTTGETTLTSTPKLDNGKPDESRRITWEHVHPPIIGSELYDAANASKDSRRNRETYTRDNTIERLEGALTCARCGGRLYLATQRKNGKTYTRYQDRKGHGMRSDKAEQYVAELMHGHIMVNSVDVTPFPGGNTRDAELDGLRKELARCNPATDDGFARIVELRARIAELDAQRDDSTPEPGKLIWLDVSMYEAADWTERRKLVRKAGIKI